MTTEKIRQDNKQRTLGNKAFVSGGEVNDNFVFVESGSVIQDAIDYINNLGGGIVRLASGTFNLSSDIQLYSNIALVGSGIGNTIIDFGDNDNNIYATGSSGSELKNILVRFLTVQNSGDADGAIDFNYIKDSDVEYVNLYSNRDAGGYPFGYAVKFANCINTNIFKCNFESNLNDIYIFDSVHCTAQKCYIKDTSNADGASIYIGGGVRISIKDNYLLDVGCEGIDIVGSTIDDTAISIINNYINSKWTSIYGSNLNRTKIALNTIEMTDDAQGDGIHLVTGDGCIINSNEIKDAGDNGIELSGADNTIINSNQIINPGVDGIDIGQNIAGADSDDTIITSNVIESGTGSAIDDSGVGTVTDNNNTS